jgi:predicted AAA+ superfamily ATPase
VRRRAHERVGHQDAHAEGFDARRPGGVGPVEDEEVGETLITACDAARRHLEAEPAQHAVQRPFDGTAADQGRDRRGPAATAGERGADTRDGDDRGDRDERVGGGDDDRVRTPEGREHAARGPRTSRPRDLDAPHVAARAKAHEIRLEGEAAASRVHEGADGIVAHRQEPHPDAVAVREVRGHLREKRAPESHAEHSRDQGGYERRVDEVPALEYSALSAARRVGPSSTTGKGRSALPCGRSASAKRCGRRSSLRRAPIACLEARQFSGKNDGMADRLISRLLEPPDRSFFLFGPRGTGKSRWLADRFPNAGATFDLLDEAVLLELLGDAAAFARKLDALRAGAWVIVDEIQRAPVLLNTVHRLIEARRLRFALCGSSARQLRRKGVNLLAGRAIERRLHPFTATELEAEFDLEEALAVGTLPLVWSSSDRVETLRAYVQTYLVQEIQAEAAVRRLPSFVRFLPVAALFHAQVLSIASLARDAGVARTTLQAYLDILEQTLLTFRLEAYRPRLRVKEVAHPKLYWADAGLVRAFKRSLGPLQEEERGGLFEGWVAQSLRAMNDYAGLFDDWFYWSAHGSSGAVEVDFMLRRGKRLIAVEAKGSRRYKVEMTKGLRAIAALPGVERRILVYGGKDSWRTEDGIDVMSATSFIGEMEKGL